MVGVPAWARATLERGLETAEMGLHQAYTGEMRPEGAFQRTQERMHEVILGRGLNIFVICVHLRVVCGRCARSGARDTERCLETAEMC